MDEKEIMEKTNELIKQNKVIWDSHEGKLLWIYDPELHKKLREQTVESKIRK